MAQSKLRVRTLPSIKPEISQALPSPLEEICNNEDARSFRTFAQPHHSRGALAQHPPGKQQSRFCPLCMKAKRSSAHFLSECRFLPESARKYLAKARQIQGIIDTDSDIEDTEETPTFELTVSLVSNKQSPYLDVFHQHTHIRLTIDSGATGNMISYRRDYLTFLQRFTLFFFEGLVIEKLDIDVFAEIPFMESNHISVRPYKHQVLIGDNTVYTYGASLPKHISQCDPKAHVLRTVASTTIWPGDYLEVDVPKSVLDRDGLLAVEPHLSGSFVVPSILHSVGNKIRIENICYLGRP